MPDKHYSKTRKIAFRSALLPLFAALIINGTNASAASAAEDQGSAIDTTTVPDFSAVPDSTAADTTQSKSGYEEDIVLGGSGSVSGDIVDDDLKKNPLIGKNFANRYLGGYYRFKRKLNDKYGLALGVDYSFVNQFSNFSTTDKQAASGIFRVFGTWRVFGSTGSTSGRVVYRIENRHVIGSGITPRDLGFDGGSSLSTATFKSFGWGVTSLYWKQTFKDQRYGLVVGKMDPGDFSDVYVLLTAYKAFMNDAYFNNPSVSLPQQGFGIVGRISFLDNWYLSGGINDANGSPTEIGIESFFKVREYYTWFETGWAPNQNAMSTGEGVHLNVWHQDPRIEKDTEETWGVTVSANRTFRGRYSPFLRAGNSSGDGGELVRFIAAAGIGIHLRGTDFLGLATSWSGPPDKALRNQVTSEFIYRLQLLENLQVSPNIQFTINPSQTLETDALWVVGVLRVRISF